MAEFRQIRKVRLNYDADTEVTLPKALADVDVIALPHATNSNINVPYLVYLYLPGTPGTRTSRTCS